MKKNYETPEILLTVADDVDIITASKGDTPWTDAFDW